MPTKIAVVLPTLGSRLELLEHSLASIREQYSQALDIHLVVVVPRDATQARRLAKKFGASLIDDPGKGMSAAMNVGIDVVDDAQYYAWMSDSDFYRPGALQRLSGLLNANPDAVLAFGACDYVTKDSSIIGSSRAGSVAPYLLAWGPNLIPHPGTMIRVSELKAVGRYSESLKYSMDTDLLLKLKRRGRFVHTSFPVSAFRLHDDSLSLLNKKASFAEAKKVRRSYLPAALRPLSPLWETVWQIQSDLATKREERLARASH
jgi:glycosyltransferase involved in cell wall biosynthesis